MKKSFKKSLVYLIMTMLVLPTWIVTGITSATHVRAAGPTTLAEWNFDSSSVIPDTDLLGGAVFSEDSSGSQSYVIHESGKAYSSNNWDVGEYYEIGVDTTGYKNLQLTFNDIASSNGPTEFNVEYFDGTVFKVLLNSVSPIFNSGPVYDTKSFDLASVTEINDNANAKVRITLTEGGISTSGTWKIDNVKITAADTDLTAYNLALLAVVPTDYTIASWATYQAIVAANVVTAVNTQPEVDAATLAITTAQDNLVTNIAADGLATATAIVAAKTPSDYTQASWNIFSIAAIDALALPDTTNTEILAKTTAINNAISNLIFAGQANLDTAKAAEALLISTNYVDFSAVTTALALPETTNAEVVAKTTAINSAIVGLVSKSVLSVPVITTTKIESGDDKSIKVEWQGLGNGVTKYEVYVNGVTSNDRIVNVSSPDDSTTKYSKEINISSVGTYSVYVKAYRGTEVAQSTTSNVVFTTPVPVATVEAAPVTTSVAPQKVQASAPVAEQKIETPVDDSNGQIKGDEETNNDTEKVNWTPWIVLFVLIILAGAATGGYFYWFAGEDEVRAVVKEPKKEQVSQKVVTTVKSKTNNNKTNKKAKRW